MRKTIMLAMANIRKNKGSVISLLLFVLIAATLLNVGLVLFLDYGKNFDARSDLLYAPHTVVLQPEVITTDEQVAFFENYPGVTEVEKQGVLSYMGDYYMNGSKALGIIIIANAENRQNMNPPRLIGPSVPLADNAVYVPYLMKTAGGYELGDQYRINLSGKELDFTVAGFTEEIPFGSMMNNMYRYYVSDEMYSDLSALFPDESCFLLSARLTDSSLGAQLQLDYSKEFFLSSDNDDAAAMFVQSLSYDAVRESRTVTSTIMSMIVIAFAVILLCVSLIVIRFRIINSIEEGVVNIGALKSVGYGSGQIISSIVLQFAGTTLIGAVAGVALSQLALPVIGKILETQSAVLWTPSFNIALSLVTLVFMLSSITLISVFVAGRIRKLHPLTALRSGSLGRGIGKNRAPLDKSRGPLSFLLALKQLLNNKKQAVMIAVIIALVSFAAIAAISVYYNIGVEPDAFTSIIAGEKPDAGFILKSADDSEGFIERLGARPEIRKAFGYQPVSVLAGGYDVSTWVTEDFGNLEGPMLYEGRYPSQDNEVALNGLLAEALGKKIGDHIIASTSGSEKEFVISGLVQVWENGGITMVMTYDGLLTLQNEFKYNQIYAYLTEGTNVAFFIDEIKNSEGDIFNNTIDMKELIDSQFSSYGGIFAMVAAGMLAITALVIILVLYLVIKAMILRRKKELGIQKALGYTTMQLMVQTALNFTPVVFIGVAVGGLCGHFGFNPIFTALVRSAGIIETHLPSPTAWTIVTCLALTALAYLVSMLISWRIRRISPYALVSE